MELQQSAAIYQIHFLYSRALPFTMNTKDHSGWSFLYKMNSSFILPASYASCGECLDFRPLLGLDFPILTAFRGRNPNLKADAFAPTVPNFPSAAFASNHTYRSSYIDVVVSLLSQPDVSFSIIQMAGCQMSCSGL
jgi:hypothetical protein